MITNTKLDTYLKEVSRLDTEMERLDIQKEAMLTVSSIELNKVYNNLRLDYSHLSNAISAVNSNDLDNTSFKLVNQTILDLFMYNEDDFTFKGISTGRDTCTFLYTHISNMVIALTFPYAVEFDSSNVESLRWGIISAYRVQEQGMSSVYNTIIESDNPDIIKDGIKKYLYREDEPVSVALL